jgi:hypothetical protein
MADEPTTPPEAQLDSNTASKQRGGKPFTKGDPRINRKGRPKSFDELRELARQIAQEPHPSDLAKAHGWTRIEVLLRDWVSSGNKQKQQAFVETAYGKVPDELKLDFTRMTDAELRAWLAPLLTRFGLDIAGAGDADSQSEIKGNGQPDE